MCKFSFARIVFLKIPLASSSSTLSFSYLAEKCPIINRLALQSFAIFAASDAVEWNVCFALSELSSSNVLSWYNKSTFFIILQM